MFQNTYAFVSLSSPPVPVRSLPLYHPLFFSFRFFPLFLRPSFSLLPALLRLAFIPVSRFRFSLSCPLFRNVPFCRFSSRNFPLALSRASTYSLVPDPRSSSNHRDLVGQPLATCIPYFPLSSFHPSVSFGVSLSPGWSIALFSSLCLAAPSLHLSLSIAGGFSFADVYISRQVGMQGRTSCSEHVCAYTCKDSRGRHTHAKLPRYVCITVAERPLPWLSFLSWECIQGNIACTCRSDRVRTGSATRVRGKCGKMGGCIVRWLSVCRDTHVCHPVCHPCIKRAHACVTHTGSVEDLPSFLRAFFSYRSTLKYALD